MTMTDLSSPLSPRTTLRIHPSRAKRNSLYPIIYYSMYTVFAAVVRVKVVMPEVIAAIMI